jgi:hypothetical protein
MRQTAWREQRKDVVERVEVLRHTFVPRVGLLASASNFIRRVARADQQRV